MSKTLPKQSDIVALIEAVRDFETQAKTLRNDYNGQILRDESSKYDALLNICEDGHRAACDALIPTLLEAIDQIDQWVQAMKHEANTTGDKQMAASVKRIAEHDSAKIRSMLEAK